MYCIVHYTAFKRKSGGGACCLFSPNWNSEQPYFMGEKEKEKKELLYDTDNYDM